MEKSFEQLVCETLAKIKEFNIKSKTVIKVFRRSCRQLKAYLEENNLEFSLENGQKWLSSIYPPEPVTHSQCAIRSARRRTVFMLSECQEGKLDSWRIYPQKTAARPKTPEYLQLIRSHEERLRTDGMAKATIGFSLLVDSDFFIYLEASGKFSIDDAVLRDITGYFAQDSFYGRKPEGVKAYAYKLKSFLTFLEDTGTIKGKKLSLAVPKVFAKQESIVTVLSESAVKTLRSKDNMPDAGAAVRDYAMVLLALRLGMRQSDIIKLKLTDIDWKNDSISFVQQKTGVPIILPLQPDVGNALMNYILHHRPHTSCETVFLRHYAPYCTLSRCCDVARRYLAVFDDEDCPQHGFHILRRTLATTMLKNNIPRSIISAALGQTDPNSVDVYLSADEEKMRRCTISLSGIECAKGDLL